VRPPKDTGKPEATDGRYSTPSMRIVVNHRRHAITASPAESVARCREATCEAPYMEERLVAGEMHRLGYRE